MLQCKLAEGSNEAFVRDVKAAPEPHCVLFYDWQLNDVSRFTTKPGSFTVLTADTTYNLGDLYVTPTTYQQSMLVYIIITEKESFRAISDTPEKELWCIQLFC